MYAKTEQVLDEAVSDVLKEGGTHRKFVARFLSFYNIKKE